MDNNLINTFNPVFLIKLLTLAVIGFYVVFAFVVYVQAKKMTKTLYLHKAEGVIKSLSVIHIIITVSLFFLALVIL